MEQRDIEIFLTLAEELHFGRTAERLHVSTARVSQSIAKWERRVGVPLFERTSRRVALTPVGHQLHEDIGPAYRQLLTGIERAVTAGRDVRGLLRVGFFSAAGGRIVVEVADAFRARYPDCEVRIREVHFSDGIGPLLHAGELDMLLSLVGEPGLTASPALFRARCLLAVSARHRLADRDSVTLADMGREVVLRLPPEMPDYWAEALAPGCRPAPGRRGAARPVPRPRRCLRSSAPARAYSPSRSKRPATTSGQTSRSCQSGTLRRSSGGSSGGPATAPPGSAPSLRPRKTPSAHVLPRPETLQAGAEPVEARRTA